MQFRWKQVGILLVVFVTTIPLRAAEPQGPYARQLAAECDALMQAAIRRPYGWAWDNVPPVGPAQTLTAPRHVTLGPLGTPAAGLLLLWSGQLLDEPKYLQAAIDTARGIATAQGQTGKIPLHALFGPAPSGRDELVAVPERAATGASLAFFLTIATLDQPKPELISRSQLRAAQWLVRQQARDGGWSEGFSYGDDPVHDTIPIIRLDNPSYRDSTLAMLLLSQGGDDKQFTPAATKAVHKLLSLRLSSPIKPDPLDDPTNPTTAPSPPQTDAPFADAPTTGPSETSSRIPLWSTGYRMNGQIDKFMEKLPAGADISASRYAMQTLLADYLLTGDRQDGLALDAARHALADLRQADGSWKTFYRRDPTTAPADDPTTQSTGSIFHLPPPPVPSGTFDLDATLNAIDQLKLVGRDRYLTMLAAQPFTFKQQLAATMCGLLDNPLTLDLPVSRTEIEPYLKKHESDWAILQGPVPEDLSLRLKRLWILLLRAKLERKMQS